MGTIPHCTLRGLISEKVRVYMRVYASVRVRDVSTPGTRSRLRTQTQGPDAPCLNLDFSTDWCEITGKFPLLFGPQFPHLYMIGL